MAHIIYLVNILRQNGVVIFIKNIYLRQMIFFATGVNTERIDT
jgi:hypothetical protein